MIVSPQVKLYLTSLIIQTAVALKNTTEQYPQFALKSLGGMFAKILFAVGWALFAINLSTKWDRRRIIALVGAAMIVTAVFSVKMAKKAGRKPNPFLAALFPIGWIVVTVALMYVSGRFNHLAWIGTALVLISMMLVLPWQRKHGIVDSVGYSMFALAWVLFAFVKYGQLKQ